VSGNYLFAHQTGGMQGNNVTPELRAQGFDPGNNKFTRYNDISLDLGGPIVRDKLWFYGAYGYNYSGLLIPGFISIERRAGRVLHAARQPDLQADVSDLAQQQVRGHRSSSIASGSPIATRARSCRSKPRRTRSRGPRSAPRSSSRAS
jgi:hypothetical protein